MPGAKGVDVIGSGPREAGHVNVRDAGELPFGLADGPAHDFDAGEPLGGGELRIWFRPSSGRMAVTNPSFIISAMIDAG